MIDARQANPAPQVPLGRNRNFNIFWLGQSLSTVGDAFSLIGLPLVVLQATNSVVQMSLVTALIALCQFFSGFLSGVLADRVNRRWLMIICDVGRLLLYASLPLAWWLDGPQVWLIYLAGAIGGALAITFEITVTAAIVNLVDSNQIVEANARMQISYGVAFMFGPALAGLVSGRFGPVWAIGVDGISFAASIVTLVLIRFRPAMEQPGGESDGPGFLNQWLTGLHFLLNNRPLRAITLIIMLYYAVTAGALNLFLFYLKSNLNQSDEAVGFITGLASAGAILAGLFISIFLKRFGFGVCFIASLALCSLSIGTVGLVPSVLLAAPLTVLFSLTNASRTMCAVILRQQVTPDAMLGRVTAVYRTVTIFPAVIGALLAAWLSGEVGAPDTLLIIGLLGLVVSFLTVFTTARLRHPEELGRTGGQAGLNEHQRRRWRRNFVFGLSGFLVFVILLSGSGTYWFFIRPLPQTSGQVNIPGLTSPVTVVRDKSGVPHITAENTPDLFMAQGYITAQDRLWQMDFNRRTGAGRLAEILGEPGLETDRLMRTLGLRAAAQREIDLSTPETRQVLDSYAKGVNAFIETHRDTLPVEFSLLGYQPEAWTPLDTVTWGRVMDFNLAGNYYREILRATLIDKFGDREAQELLPLSPVDNTPTIIPAGLSYAGFDKMAGLINLHRQIAASVAGDLSSRGSNSWVVGGVKTDTGQPILANDPHLSLSNPSIWYEIQLTAPGWNMAGVGFPGVPGVIAGHNDRIAWGVTNAEGDTQDLFMEKINPANPDQYEYKGVWQNMAVHTEEIKIKGKSPETLTVKATQHGPLLNGADAFLKDTPPVALAWTALRDAKLFQGVLEYDRASNWQEFRQALRDFNITAQNFVYADVDGNIGYQMPGLWPLRPKSDGLLPVPGWTGEYDWQGYANFDDLPTLYNPPSGFIVTANNQPEAAGQSKALIGKEFHPGWRAARITELIQAKDKLSLPDMGTIQSDLKSEVALEITGYLTAIPAPGSKIADILNRLKGWDGFLKADSVPAAIYEVTFQHIIENLFKDKFDANTYFLYVGDYRFMYPAVLALLKDPQNAWWGPGGRDTALAKATEQAVDSLGTSLGSNPDNWKWGKLHTVSFTQTPLGPALPAPLSQMINLKTVESGGDVLTVNVGTYSYNTPYKQLGGPSFRGIYNLADFDKSLIINSGGESGQPFNPHYGDDIDDWLAGRYRGFAFSASAIKAQQENVLTLLPGK